MDTMNPAERRRARSDERMAAGLPVVDRTSTRKQERRKEKMQDPQYWERRNMREKLRRKYGKGRCKETLLNGKQCPNGQYLVVKEKDGREKIYRAHWCFAHIPSEFRQRWGIGEFQPTEPREGRARKPTPTHVLKELIENELAEWLAPIRDALLADKAVVAGNGRSARIEMIPDHRTRLQAVETALDRVYGKPKQTTDVNAMMNLNADIKVPVDKDREKEVAKILLESGAIAGLATAATNPLSQN